jgi:hypothetical protein
MLIALAHICVLYPIGTTHLTYVFPCSTTIPYYWSCVKYGTYFFTIMNEVYNIRIFHLANEVCSLVSTAIRPIHITSSRCFYT